MTTTEVPASARPLTIGESTYLLEASERVVRLLALDEMWSVYLTAAQQSWIAEVDFAGLSELSGRMLDGPYGLAETGPRAAELVSSQSDQALIAGLQRLRDQYGSAELFDWLLDQAVAGNSLREVFLSAWNWILSNLDDERGILQNKRVILDAASLPDPDFRFRFKCFLVVAGIGLEPRLLPRALSPPWESARLWGSGSSQLPVEPLSRGRTPGVVGRCARRPVDSGSASLLLAWSGSVKYAALPAGVR
jgi:hypothetical protein